MTRLLRSYFFWSYERGSFHYDVMVTAILLFIFVSPHFIDFKDKPVKTVPLRASEVLVKEAGSSGNEARFIYEIRVEDLDGASLMGTFTVNPPGDDLSSFDIVVGGTGQEAGTYEPEKAATTCSCMSTPRPQTICSSVSTKTWGPLTSS